MSSTEAAPGRGRSVLIANPSADLYGSDRMILEAVRGLQMLGWRVVVTCSVDGPLVEALQTTGAEVRIQPAPVIRKSMLSVRGMTALIGDVFTDLRGMRRLIRSVDPQIVLVNTVTLPFWTVAARLCRKPVAVYVHEAESSLSAPARTLLTTPLRLATGVIFNSETSRRVTGSRRLHRRGRERVMANGVVGPGVVTAAREELTDPFRIVYVGRLSPRKGVDLVIGAAARLKDAGIHPSVQLVGAVFPGYEWYETELRDLVEELGLDGDIRFMGFHDDVWAAFEYADVAVVPSRSDESFGNVVVEALMSARPVIVADHSGLREAADGLDAALLVPADDVESLADGLMRVHEEWPTFRLDAQRDARQARSRYDPALQHALLSDILIGWARPAVSHGVADWRSARGSGTM